MKRLPIYGLLLTGYTIIIIGVVKFIKGLELISTVTLETQQTAIKFAPLLFISVVVLLLSLSVGTYLISALWKYFKAHKTMLVIPFLIIIIGITQFAIVGLQSINTLIISNTESFVANNEIYIKALMTFNTYTIIGLQFVIGSVGYSFYLKFTA